MKTFSPGKNAILQMKNAAEDQSRRTGLPHGVSIVFGNDDVMVTEIRLSHDDTIAFRHISKESQEPNTLIIGGQQEFGAEVIPGHSTKFFGAGLAVA